MQTIATGDTGARRRTPRWLLILWVPVLAAALVLTLLCFGAALFYPRQPQDLWDWLRPDQPWTASVTLALWILAFVAYALPRRGQNRPFVALVIAGLALLGVLGGLATYLPWSGASDLLVDPVLRTLRLFAGETPQELDESAPPFPIALQIAAVAAISATFAAAALAAFTLWRRQFARIRMRFLTFTDVVIGVDDSSVPLVRRLVSGASQPRAVAVLVASGAPSDLLKELDALGVMVLAADSLDPGALQVLLTRPTLPATLPGRTGRARIAVERVYVVESDPSRVGPIAEAVRRLLERCSHPVGIQVQVIVRLSDSEHARGLRLAHVDSPPHVVLDAVVPAEETSIELIGRVLADHPDVRTLVLCGDTALTGALVSETRRRRREQHLLHEAATADPSSGWASAPPDRRGQDPADLIIVDCGITEIVVIDPAADDIKRAHDSRWKDDGLSIVSVAADWRTHLLTTLTSHAAGARSADGHTAVVVTGEPEPSTWQAAVRAAQLSAASIWYHVEAHGEAGRPIARANLHEFTISVLLAGALPETTWNRIGRLQHEMYRRRRFPAADAPVPPERLPWWHRDENKRLPEWRRRDNVQQARGVMHSVALQGYRWQLADVATGAQVFSGDVQQIASREHDRWLRAMTARGYRAQPAPGVPAGKVNPNCVPWEDLDEESQAWARANVADVLHTMAVIGYVPIPVEPGKDPPSERDRRSAATS